MLLKAVQYWYDRYDLLFSNRGGTFTGASYTDINAVLPAKIILMCIAVICAVGFVVGAFTRSIKLPAIALALLVLSSVLIGGVWPLVLQQVVVNPNGINREPEFIARNIDATRAAYNIQDDQINYIDYPGQLAGDPQDIISDQNTLPNARLLDPNVLSPTFTQQQQLRNFYGFPDQLAMDRYTVNGKTQDYVVAVRELNADGLNDAQKNWINEHMVFTHGDGFIAAPANTVDNGYPDYVVSDIAAIDKKDNPIPVAAAAHLLRPADHRLRDRRRRWRGGPGVRHRDHALHLHRRGWCPGRQPVRPHGVRDRVRRGQLPVLRGDQRQLQDHVQPRSDRTGAEGRAVPDHRHQGLPGGGRRPDRLDRRRATPLRRTTRTHRR